MFQSSRPNLLLPEVTDVDPKEVHQLQTDLFIVDVRSEGELIGELGHISLSHHIPLDELAERLDELPDDDNQTTVFICRSGGRSSRAAEMALSQGRKNVYNMAGGMIAWNELGFESQRTR